MKTCCITGHLPFKLSWGYSNIGKEYKQYKDKLTKMVMHLIDNGYTKFISGMALGVDMDFAETVHDIKRN